MSTSVLPVALGADIIQAIKPRRKSTNHKKTGGAFDKQSPLIDVTFWVKKSKLIKNAAMILEKSSRAARQRTHLPKPIAKENRSWKMLVVGMAE